MAQYDVSDRSAIVTGAGSGIGRSAALLLAQNGASVVVNDLNAEAAQDVVDEIRAAGGVAAASVGDATDAEWIASSIDLAGTLAPLRIGVNNAGISGASFPTAEYPGDDWDKVIAINLNAVFRNMKAQIPTILDNGGGSVVNIASILGSVGFA
ncbi:MAG: SDR family NAD(P)-dependent oxidoreductase, partial [Microbacterium sp.]